MTPAEHLAEAEKLLDAQPRDEHGWPDPAYSDQIYTAIGHALIALAIEAGVPHPAQAAG